MKRAKTLFADREVEFANRDLAMKQVEGLAGLERLGGRVCGVVLFGSVARGLAGADSYIDVLIVVDSVIENIRRALGGAGAGGL